MRLNSRHLSGGKFKSTSWTPLDYGEHNVNIIAASRQIRWVKANGPAGVAACARAGRLKSAWRFTVRWFVETPGLSRQLGWRPSIQRGLVNFCSGKSRCVESKN